MIEWNKLFVIECPMLMKSTHAILHSILKGVHFVYMGCETSLHYHLSSYWQFEDALLSFFFFFFCW